MFSKALAVKKHGSMAQRSSTGSRTSEPPRKANPGWERLSRWHDAMAGTDTDSLERDADRMAEAVLRHPGSIEQRDASEPSTTRLPDARGLLASSGRPLEPAVREEFEDRFGRDFSGVRVHTDDHAARSAGRLDALAFTLGQNIAFSHGTYAPHTAGGKHLLAHELAHTVQQSRGLSAGRVQRRRVPSSSTLASSVPPATDPVGVRHARTGLARLLSRSWASLSSSNRRTVQTAAAGFGITFSTEANLRTALNSATRAQLIQFADAVRTADPSRILGDPALIDTGPRPGTSDAANIRRVVRNANAIFATIAGGSRDADIAQVFGTAHVATAKAKYARARTRMNALHTAGKIVTDRSGYNAEVGLGGLTNSAQISVGPEVIDNPDDGESIITLIHEAMHAGNSSVDDFGYITQPSFTVLPAATKLNNAAHYEVVPRRIRGMAHSFPGQTFVPAGTTAGGVTSPPLTPRQQAVRDASETYRSAWAAGLNLHSLFVQVHHNPSQWNTLDLHARYSGAQSGSRFSNTLPFWSKVEALTIHNRLSQIDPAGVPAVKPVTIIDIALSEGMIRKLSHGMNRVPQTEADAARFETAHATRAERTAAAASVTAERDLLIRLVIRAHLGSITGDERRDARAIAQLAQASQGADYTEFLKIRSHNAFP